MLGNPPVGAGVVSGGPKRRRVARLGAAVAIGLAVSLLLGACSKTSGSSSGGKIVLRVQQQAGDEKPSAVMKAAFEKAHPNVKVQLLTISQDQKGGSNLAVLSGANAPDVGFVPTNSSVYTELVANKKLEDLSDVWQKSDLPARYGKDISQALTGGGKPYVISIDSTFYSVVWYNKDLFSKLGIATPADHRFKDKNELYAAVAALKKAGKQGLALGGNTPFQVSWMVDAMLPTSTTPDQMGNYNSSYAKATDVTAKYTDPAFLDVLKQLQEYNQKGVYAKGFLGIDDYGAETLWYQQKAGMVLDGSYSTPRFIQSKVSFKFGWLLLPPVNPSVKTQMTAYVGDAVAIPTSAKHKALAKEWAELYVSKAMQEKAVIDAAGKLPIVNDVDAAALKKFNPNLQEMVADAAANGSQSGWTSTVPGPLGQAFINPLIQAMYNGQTTPGALATKQQAQLDKTRS